MNSLSQKLLLYENSKINMQHIANNSSYYEYSQQFSFQKIDISKLHLYHQSLIENEINQQKLQSQYFKLLNDIENLHQECEEEGYEASSEIARKNAKDILLRLCRKFPNNEYFIYPTEDREIAIDCNPVDKRGILILCDSDGGLAFFVTIDGKNNRHHFDQYSDFPDDLLWKSFDKMENYYHASYTDQLETQDQRRTIPLSLKNKYRSALFNITQTAV